MRRACVIFLMSLALLPFQTLSASASCQNQLFLYNQARSDGVSPASVVNSKYKDYTDCLKRVGASGTQSQTSEEERLEQAISAALGKGDLAAASSLVQQLRSYNSTKANSYQTQIENSSPKGCDYNGKYYASCDDAQNQYQKDLDAYNKQVEAAKRGSTTQKWQCAGQVFESEAQAKAHCDSLNAAAQAKSTLDAKAAAELKAKQEADLEVSRCAANLKAAQLTISEISILKDAYKSASTTIPVYVNYLSWIDKMLLDKSSQYADAQTNCPSPESIFELQTGLAVIRNQVKVDLVIEGKRIVRENNRVEAEAKAKAEREAQAAQREKIAAEAAAEAKAAIKAEAAKKKSTITCVIGKTIKKVTAVNPKCPSGYKKK